MPNDVCIEACDELNTGHDLPLLHSPSAVQDSYNQLRTAIISEELASKS